MFFGFWKKRNKRKKRTYSFTGHLITRHLITQLPEVSTSKSRSPNIKHLTQKCGHMKLCNWELCDKCLYVPITSGQFWGQNFYRHSANLIFLWLFALFWNVISKKRKKSCFLKSEKKRKIRILEHWLKLYYRVWVFIQFAHHYSTMWSL